MKLIPDWILWPKEIMDLPEPCKAHSMDEYYARKKARDRAWNKRRLKEVMVIGAFSLVLSSLIVGAVASAFLDAAAFQDVLDHPEQEDK